VEKNSFWELPKAQIHSNEDRYQTNLVLSCCCQLPGMDKVRICTIWNYTCFTTWIILVYNEQHLLYHSPFHLPLSYFQKNHKQHRNYSSLQKAAESWSQLPTRCSRTLKQGPKQTGQPLCWVPDWLFCWFVTTQPSVPCRGTAIFSLNSLRSWEAMAWEVNHLQQWV